MEHSMEELSCRRVIRRLNRFHRQHPFQMDGEFDHSDQLNHSMLLVQVLVLVLEQLPAYYSRKPLPTQSHTLLVQLT